jgi:diaminopimelate decarboxylase
MATGTALSHVFPMGSRLNERGRIEVGGCDTIELARQFGTPAYVVAEDDLRARAHAFMQAGAHAEWADMQVVFGSKAFPCTAVLALFAEEGLWCDVASAGELQLALGAGFAAHRLVVHGNAKSQAELELALGAGAGLIVLDNFDELGRLERLIGSGARRADGAAQGVLIRVTPDVRGDTHDKISTGQADSKFGFAIAEVETAIARARQIEGLAVEGLHAHIGSQLMRLEPFKDAVAQLARLGTFPVLDVGGGLGVAYVHDDPPPPEVEEYVEAIALAAREHGVAPDTRLLIEPGRSLTANACVTLYEVQSVKRNLSTWVAVDGGMSDNLRPMLYSARYEAHIADRPGGGLRCVLAGKHCESGDVIVADALLDDPKAGDIVVTPATGAYGHALANNYNGVPRPPVVFCKDGDARVVVRRETIDDLSARDVR